MREMNTETTKDGNNITAGDVPDLSREGNNDGFSHNEVPTLTGEMLPKLTERFLEQARSDSMTEWARGFFDAYPPGMIHMDSDRGFVLESMTSAGIEVEIDGFAQITTAPASSPAEEVGTSEERLPDASSESMLDLAEAPGIVEPEIGTTASIGPRETDLGMWC